MLSLAHLFILLHLSSTATTAAAAVDFIYNSFNSTADLDLIRDARVQPPVIRLTNDSNQFSLGRAFYSSRVSTQPITNYSFSTQFIFSILPEISSSPGFGIAFVLSNSTEPNDALAGQYFGLFAAAANSPVAPLIAVEFDTGLNTEFNDPDGNHVGIDLNNIESVVTQGAGYFNSTGGFVPVNMRTGRNIHAWIEFDGAKMEINVTIAPAGMSRPGRPLLSYTNQNIGNYTSSNMFIGFSASKTTWVEAQRVLAWSFTDTGRAARNLNTSNLPVFMVQPSNSSSSSLSAGAVAGIIIGCVAIFICILGVCYWLWRKYKRVEEDEVEDWELEYWPHRYSYDELHQATKGFSDNEVLGAGGFGKVYKGTLANQAEVAVKCVNHDSKQGLREFMAEISSIGRLQHKNLVQMKGWCRKGNELLLVYEYMPNGSLNKWIFDKPKTLLCWEGRKKVLTDVAEGLNYLHHGWEQVVIHRDIKSSNVLLGLDMRAKLGDFGLAKLYTHGEVPNTTRVVGTLGYLAPELARLASPTAASDVYSFGVVILEVACGRRPIETWAEREEDVVLVDWVREKYIEGKLLESADVRINGEYKAEEMEGVLKLGLSCCHPDPQHRPAMREVVALLLGEDAAGVPRVLVPELVQDSEETKEEDSPSRLPPQGPL